MENNFRIQSKQFFLTFPKVGQMDFKEIKSKLVDNEKDLSYLLISQEKHKDESTHYHLVLVYSKRKNITKSDHGDYLFNKHGDYTKVRNITKSIKYAKKDGNYYEGGKEPQAPTI